MIRSLKETGKINDEQEVQMKLLMDTDQFYEEWEKFVNPGNIEEISGQLKKILEQENSEFFVHGTRIYHKDPNARSQIYTKGWYDT